MSFWNQTTPLTYRQIAGWALAMSGVVTAVWWILSITLISPQSQSLAELKESNKNLRSELQRHDGIVIAYRDSTSVLARSRKDLAQCVIHTQQWRAYTEGLGRSVQTLRANMSLLSRIDKLSAEKDRIEADIQSRATPHNWGNSASLTDANKAKIAEWRREADQIHEEILNLYSHLRE